MAIWDKIIGGHQHSDDSIETMVGKVAAGEAVVLDVRSQEERDAGFIRDSVFIPFSKFESLNESSKLLAALPKDKIVYCH